MISRHLMGLILSIAVVGTAPAELAAQEDFDSHVRNVAQRYGVGIPLAQPLNPDITGTPPEYRALLGAWGPTSEEEGTITIVVIKAVDTLGHAVVIRGYSGCCQDGSKFMPGFTFYNGTAAGGKITIQYNSTYDKHWQRREFLARPDGVLTETSTNLQTGGINQYQLGRIR